MKKHSGTIYQLLIAGMLGFGALIAAAVTIGFIYETFQSFFPRDYGTSLFFTEDGQPYLWHWDPDPERITYVDLDGNPVEGDNYSHGVSLTPGDFDRQDQPLQWSLRISPLQVRDRNTIPSHWYLMRDARSNGGAYLVGYSAKTKQRIGFIGTAGFRTEPLPREEWFAVEGYSPAWYTNADEEGNVEGSRFALNCVSKIFVVNLETHQVQVIADDLPLPVRSIQTFARGRVWYLALLTDDALYLIEAEGQRRVFPLPAALQGRPLDFGLRPDGGLTVAVALPQVFGSAETHDLVYVLAADGTLSEPRQVTLKSASNDNESMFLLLFGSPLPELFTLLVGDWQWKRYEGIHSASQYAKLVWWRDRWWIFAATLEAAFLAAICYRRQSRFRFPMVQRIVWAGFVFLFGIPGWIGYRHCRHWPVLEVCPSCQRPSPRNDEVCAVCGREFPAPELKGTEIFA